MQVLLMVTWFIETHKERRTFKYFEDALWMHRHMASKGIKAILGGYASARNP